MKRGDQTLLKGSQQLFGDDGTIFKLDSYSEIELKELKEKFISNVERIKNMIKKIEARELELEQVKNVELDKQVKSKIVGRKHAMSISPEREAKRKRVVKKMDLNSLETRRVEGETKRKRVVKTIELNSMETRKVEALMMRKCGGILEKLMSHKHGWVFNTPVDVVALRLSDYHEVVKRPMDLGTVKKKLGKGVYRNPIDFAKDVRLTFDNALLYNRKGEDAHTMATDLLDMFDKLFDPIYKKFKAEHEPVFNEQQIFSKPRQSEVVTSQRDTEKPLQMHSQAEVPMKISEEADKEPVSKQKSLVQEAKENSQMKREMSIMEREQLGLVLQELDEEYLKEILRIVAKRNSHITTPNENDEIELDVETIDSETMWDIHRFLRLKLKAK